jgi:hypothetical protein
MPNITGMRAEFIYTMGHEVALVAILLSFFTPSLRSVFVHNTPHNRSMSLAVFTVPARALLVMLSC